LEIPGIEIRPDDALAVPPDRADGKGVIGSNATAFRLTAAEPAPRRAVPDHARITRPADHAFRTTRRVGIEWRPQMKTFLSSALALAAACTLAASASAQPSAPPQGAAAVQFWHAAARDAIARQKPNQQAALRVLAYLSWAQHQAAEAQAARAGEASEAAWDALFDRASLTTLSALLPEQAGELKRLAETRPAASGEAVAQAQATADRAAAATLARAAGDAFDAPWAGSLPNDANAWRSQLQPPRPPHLPALGGMRPFFIASGSALRPNAPPATDSAAFRQALDEVRRRSSSGDPAALLRARQWEMVTGSLVAGHWDETAGRLNAAQRLSGPQSARVYAAVLGATMDANIACHDAKYTYWAPRPSQADAALKPLAGLPNHPSYPSNHACDSGAAAEVLGGFFPAWRETLRALAADAAQSRIDAGLHYAFDGEAGLAIGRAAARAALRALGPETVAAR
jgi:hypothetical protein